MKKNKLAIVGGGQLGMMLHQAAESLGVEVVVLDKKGVSAHQVGAVLVEGGIQDPEAVRRLAGKWGKDTPITIEVEHVAIDALSTLQKEGYVVHPDPDTMNTIADKYMQKQFLKANAIPVADFELVDSEETVSELLKKWDHGIILKARRGGYDGRGNVVIRNVSDITSEKVKQMIRQGDLYAEKLFPFKKELAAIMVRDARGRKISYPIVETIHENNICNIVISPARIDKDTQKKAEDIAFKTVEILKGAGVFAIEMFAGVNGEVVVNEIAPRVHNSGHLTIEANKTDQFKNHVLAVTSQELGSTEMVVPYAVMINILQGKGTHDAIVEKVDSKGFIHWYGKEGRMPPLEPRKIGHVTGLGDTFEEAMSNAQEAHKRAMRNIA